MQEPFPNFPTEPPQKPAGEPLPPQEETPAPPTEQPVPPVQNPLPPVQNTPQNNPIPPMQNPIPNWYQNQQPTMGNWQIPPQVPPAPPQKQPLTPEQKDRRTAFWLKIVAALLAALLLYCIGSDVLFFPPRGGGRVTPQGVTERACSPAGAAAQMQSQCSFHFPSTKTTLWFAIFALAWYNSRINYCVYGKLGNRVEWQRKNENQRNGVLLPAVKRQNSGSRQGLAPCSAACC